MKGRICAGFAVLAVLLFLGRAETGSGPTVISLGSVTADARAVNAQGQIVGRFSSGGGSFLWHRGVLTNLGSLGGGTAMAWSTPFCGKTA